MNVPYSIFVHNGTWKMKARPYLFNASEANKNKWVSMILAHSGVYMPTITSEGLVWDAIYLALRNDAGCIAVFPYSDGKAAVFDETNVPVGLNPPYIVLGESVSTPANVFGKKGQDVVATIHGWSEYQGKTEILKMHDAIFNVLDDGQ